MQNYPFLLLTFQLEAPVLLRGLVFLMLCLLFWQHTAAAVSTVFFKAVCLSTTAEKQTLIHDCPKLSQHTTTLLFHLQTYRRGQEAHSSAHR